MSTITTVPGPKTIPDHTPDPDSRQPTAAGFILLVSGALSLAISASCASATAGALDVSHLLLLRSGVWLLWLAPWALRHPAEAWGRNHLWLALQAVANTLFLFLYTLALIRVPVALATTMLAGTTPLWTAALDRMLNRVRPSGGAMLGMAGILVGIALLVRPQGQGTGDIIGLLAAVGSAASFSLVFIAIGRLRSTDSANAMNLWYTVLVMAVVVPMLGMRAWPDDPRAWGFAAGYGLFGLLGQTALVMGTARLTPAIGAVNGALVPVFASIIGVTLFHQALDGLQVVGLAMVLGCTGWVSVADKRKSTQHP